MKKILPIIIVLAAIVAGVFLMMRDKPAVVIENKPGRSAQLAPADAVAYAEIPDVVRTMKRWESTGLYKISQEPEWKEFSAKFGDFFTSAMAEPGNKMFADVLSQVQEADPAGFFIAVSGIEKPMPSVVGGLPYRGKTTVVKGAIEKLREAIMKGAAAPKSEIVKFESNDIEVITAQSVTYVFCYRDNWFFFASDLDGMKGVLQRYAGAASAPKGLDKDPEFLNATKQGLGDFDLAVFANTRKMLDAEPNARKGMPEFFINLIPESVGYTVKLDGPLMKDRLYYHAPKFPRTSPMGNRLLKFTTENTYTFGSFSTEGWEALIKETIKELAKVGPKDQMDAVFASKGLKLEDILTTFGSEASIHSDWQAGVPIPDAFAAIEVKDAAKAKKFAELIAAAMADSGKMSQKEEDGASYWTLSGLGFAQPTLAVNDKYMVLAWNYTSAVGALKRAKEAQPGLGENARFQEALTSVGVPTAGTFYLDVKTLFERVYEQYKPLLASALAGNEVSRKFIDPAKLPKTETIAKHLAPTIVVYADAHEGITLETSGTVALYPVMVPVAGAFAFLGVRSAGPIPPPPAVQGSPVPPAATPSAPPQPAPAPQ